MPSNHYPRIGTRNHWLKIGLMTVLLLGSGASGLNAREALSEPLEEIEAFATAGVAGILVLPAGVPDRPTPAILILQDAQGPDGRANHYVDHLLGAGFAVLEVLTLESDSLEGVLSALSAHPRVAGRPLGLLGFGAGARLAAEWSGPVSARALLYPGCGGLVPAAMRGEAVLLMHGMADPANEPGACAGLGQALGASGVSVRLRAFDHASYAWDRPVLGREGHALLPRPDGPGRVLAEAWPTLTALSATEVAGFFATNLHSCRP